MARARAQGVAIPEGKTFSSDVATDPGARMGERTFLNALEQMGAFLAALWMCACLVSPSMATWLGGTAVFFRALFPIFWSMGAGGNWNIRVELSTQPYYVCVLGMFGATLIWGLTGYNVSELPLGQLGGVIIGSYLALFAVVLGIGSVLHRCTYQAYEAIW